jgi:AraC family transcriptional regulator
MLLTLVGLFFRELNDRRRPFQDTAQQAVQIMSDHFHENISIAALAKKLLCSEGHFFRTFKDFTGQTPVAYLNSMRIKQAALYLTKTNLPVNQIAKLCGFEDPYYFSRTFHKINGQSPKSYREMKSS